VLLAGNQFQCHAGVGTLIAAVVSVKPHELRKLQKRDATVVYQLRHKLETGGQFFISSVSSPDFFHNAVTVACFYVDGIFSVVKHYLSQ